MNERVTIARLVDHPEAIPVLKRWFESEWTSYYGPTGPGNAERDLLAYSSRDRLPIGIVAYLDGELCGFAALKPQSITTHSHLSPWVAAGMVAPQHRRKGIGAQMLGALEDIARGLGYTRIYSGTSAADGLLRRSGWQIMERVAYNGEEISIYEKAL